MAVIPVDIDRCPATQASRESGYLWQCKFKPGHVGGCVFRRVRAWGAKR